jgi:hypothetical protein
MVITAIVVIVVLVSMAIVVVVVMAPLLWSCSYHTCDHRSVWVL